MPKRSKTVPQKKLTDAQKRKLAYIPMVMENITPTTVTDMRTVQQAFKQMVNNVFTHGVGKRGDDLRNYTGATLELLGELAIKLCCDTLEITNYTIDAGYLQHPDYDDIRLDEHLWINGQLVLMQEDRAWVDKPFASMKYQVAQDLFTLPYNKVNNISSELIIPVLCYSYDVTDATFNTRDYQFKKTLEVENISVYNTYGDYRIQFFNISGHRRDARGDYFARGYSPEECDKYIHFIYTYLENYIRSM